MKISFWAFLIGALLLIFGVVGIANELYGMNINIPWWPIIALILAIWFLSRAFKK
jgi:phosphate/sulfate permease